MTDMTIEKRIQWLNDAFRKGDRIVPGEVVLDYKLKKYLDTKGDLKTNELMERIRNFDDFEDEAPLFDQHTKGLFEFEGVTIKWIINYFNNSMLKKSSAPEDIRETKRILAISSIDVCRKNY